MKLGLILFLLLPACTLSAQMWERMNGPQGGGFAYAAFSPNGDLYVIANNIYKSTDKGNHWQRVGPNFQLSEMFEIGTRKLVWTASGAMFRNSRTELLKSVDSGRSWTAVRWLGFSNSMSDIAVPYLYVVAKDSVFRSSDDGTSWIGSKPSEVTSSIDIYVSDDGVVFASDGEKFFRSTDHGVSWHDSTTGLESGYPSTLKTTIDGKYVLALGEWLYVSTNKGLDWSRIYGQNSGIIRGMLTIGSDTIFIALQDSSILRSIDAGKTWLQFCILEHIPWVLLADTENLYMLSSWDMWRASLHEESPLEALIIPNASVTQFAVRRSGQIHAVSVGSMNDDWNYSFWSTDHSGQWNAEYLPTDEWISDLGVDAGDSVLCVISGKVFLFSESTKDWILKLELPSSDYDMVSADDYTFISTVRDGIYRTSDHGAVWQHYTVGLENRQVWTLGATDEMLYAGGPKFFLRSSDRGLTWEEPEFPFISGSGFIWAIECRGPNVIVGVERTGVYFSTDKGLTWENHSVGLGLAKVTDIVSTPSGAVFAASDSGLYEYNPVAQTWKNVHDNMLDGVVICLTLGRDGRLYVGTYDDGAYRSTNTYGSWLDVRSNEYLPDDISIYPNPASTEIKINFKSGRPEKYQAAIYNLLGESILVSNNEETINVSSLRSGQYFLRIFTDKQIQTIPLLIVE